MMRLSPHQLVIAWRLALQPFAAHDELVGALWGHDGDGGSLNASKIIHYRIHQLRQKLPAGIEIKTCWGFGYFVPEEQRGMLLCILSDEIKRNVCYQPLTDHQSIREAA